MVQEVEVVDNEVCTFDYAVEDRETTASTVEVDYALRYNIAYC